MNKKQRQLLDVNLYYKEVDLNFSYKETFIRYLAHFHMDCPEFSLKEFIDGKCYARITEGKCIKCKKSSNSLRYLTGYVYHISG